MQIRGRLILVINLPLCRGNAQLFLSGRSQLLHPHCFACTLMHNFAIASNKDLLADFVAHIEVHLTILYEVLH